MGSYNALVDLMGDRDLGGKVLLFMIDALYASADAGNNISSSFFIEKPHWQDYNSIENFLADLH